MVESLQLRNKDRTNPCNKSLNTIHNSKNKPLNMLRTVMLNPLIVQNSYNCSNKSTNHYQILIMLAIIDVLQGFNQSINRGEGLD